MVAVESSSVRGLVRQIGVVFGSEVVLDDSDMSIFVFLSNLVLVIFALAPVAALIVFCIAFRDSRNVHPIYRSAIVAFKNKATEAKKSIPES